jgi:hypothetical protein
MTAEAWHKNPNISNSSSPNAAMAHPTEIHYSNHGNGQDQNQYIDGQQRLSSSPAQSQSTAQLSLQIIGNAVFSAFIFRFFVVVVHKTRTLDFESGRDEQDRHRMESLEHLDERDR